MIALLIVTNTIEDEMGGAIHSRAILAVNTLVVIKRSEHANINWAIELLLTYIHVQNHERVQRTQECHSEINIHLAGHTWT